jgi:hypothetical protein
MCRRAVGIVMASLALAGCGAEQDAQPAAGISERGAVVSEPAPAVPPPGAAPAEPAPAETVAAAPPTQASMLEVLRLGVESELEQPVSIAVDVLRTGERWGFVTAVARSPEGRPIDYSRTRFAEDVADGVFDDWFCALLRIDGAQWSLVALEIGATDVPFVDWPERYGVPTALVLPEE